MAAESNREVVPGLVHSLSEYAKELKRQQVEGFPVPTGSGEKVSLSGLSGPSEQLNRQVPGVVSELQSIRSEIGNCQRCRLSEKRKNIVFGTGNPGADVVFVGEAPGSQEDQEGKPFVGRAGKLLTEIITKGMKMRRDDVYIVNVVKCRPPDNRNPEPDEIERCEPFLVQQLRAIKPKIVIARGKFATQTLLKDSTPISRLRGRWHTYEGIKLMPTFHPAYLLRNPKEKRLVWADIKAVLREIGRLE